MKLTLLHILLLTLKLIYCENEIDETDRCKGNSDVHDIGNCPEKSNKMVLRSGSSSKLGSLQIEIEETRINMYLNKG